MRCALGDAAALCDRIADQIGQQNRVRGGKISKHGQELAAIAKQCGDAIFAMRGNVTVPR